MVAATVRRTWTNDRSLRPRLTSDAAPPYLLSMRGKRAFSLTDRESRSRQEDRTTVTCSKKKRGKSPAVLHDPRIMTYMSIPIHVLAAQPIKKETAATPKLMESISRNCGRKGSRLTTDTKNVNRQIMQAALKRQQTRAA